MQKLPQYNIFKDHQLNQTFNNEGYVHVKLLSKETIKQLLKFYEQNKIDADSGFHTTHFSTDRALKKKIHQFIVDQVWTSMESLLLDFKPVFANYMVKEAREDSIMPLHADWCYVKEPEHCSIAAWIPLCDTTKKNGTLGVVPFSQHLSNNIRGPRILQWENPFNEKIIDKAGKLIDMKAGEAIIYNHRLLHYSPANQNSQTRHALNISAVPQNTQMIHYTVPEGFDQIQYYELENADFYLEYDNFQVPEKGVKLETLAIENAPLLNEKLNPFINNFHQKNIFTKLKELLKK